MLENCTIAIGGQTNKEERYIAPTIITNITLNHPSMLEEIFGPILPVLEFTSLEEVIHIVTFCQNHQLRISSQKQKNLEKLIDEISFGGGCINDTISHYVSPYLPFGGVGYSGIGQYHGKASFDTFTIIKAF